MNPADDEINLLLPIMLGLAILFVGVILGLIIWILHKTKVINFSKESKFWGVLKAAVLSIIGVLIISGVFGITTSIFQMIKSFLSK